LNKEKNYKAVTFDLWETLLLEKNGNNTRRIKARCKNLSNTFVKFGVNVTCKQVASAMKSLSTWLINIWKRNRDVTHLDQLQFIIKTVTKSSVKIKREWINEFSSAYISPLFEVPPYLNPDAEQVLTELKEKNMHVGLICNTGRTPGSGLRRFLQKDKVSKYFDLMLFSDEVGIRKPDPKIFHMFTTKLNLNPYEVVHVGDNLKSDVWGAKEAGFKALYFSTEVGRDKVAESDATSLVSISRKLGDLKDIVPDKTITSLKMVLELINNFK